jgi:hypothetical protein
MAAVLMGLGLVDGRAESGAVRVLLTHGGHGFEEAAFFAMFDGLPGVRYRAVSLPESSGLLKPGLEAEYDVLVMYDMVEAIAEEHQEAFLALLRQGIGVVSLHHNLAAHPGWPEFARIIGGKYLLAPEEIGGERQAPSTYSHDQDMEVRVVDSAHPITRGMEDFAIHDETYQGFHTAPEATVLLTTEHPRADRELAWTTRYGNSRVCYLLLGHDSKAWNNPAYPRLLGNAIRWAAGRE